MLFPLKSSIVGLKKFIKFPFTSVNESLSLILHSIDNSAAFFKRPALRLLKVIYFIIIDISLEDN